jgi:hypothetical protein
MRSSPTTPVFLQEWFSTLGHFIDDTYTHTLGKMLGAGFQKSTAALTSHPPQRNYH